VCGLAFDSPAAQSALAGINGIKSMLGKLTEPEVTTAAPFANDVLGRESSITGKNLYLSCQN
jgi:hypothetical protein